MWWRVAIIVLAGVLAYANSLSGPFIFDDEATVAENASIRDLRSTAVFFPQREAPTAGRPIVNVSFAVNYALGGMTVRGYHVANLAMHLLCAVVLFGLVRRTVELIRARGVRLQPDPLDIAFAVALIWTLHPLNTEVVDYVTQRTESMMALFYLTTLYAGATDRPLLAILACALGMACKESMVTAPVMVMLYDRVFVFDSVKKALRARWPLYAGLAATWIVLAAVNWSGSRIHSAGFSTGISPWTYLLNQSVMIVRYLRLAIWPRSLVLAYGAPQPMTVGDALPYALVVIGLLALTALALWRRPMLGFLGAWIFITLAPTSTIVPIATEVGAERRMYLALAAIVTLAVVGVCSSTGGVRLQPDQASRQGGRRRWIHATLLAALCIALASATVARNREYASSVGMAQTVVARCPSGFGHTLLGAALAVAGRHDDAIVQLREGARDYPKARYHLGAELFNQGQRDEAATHLQMFVEQVPYALEAVRARLMIGRALMARENYGDAITQFQLVLKMTAEHDEARIGAIGAMADALFAQEQFAEATRHYRGYLTEQPNDINGRLNLAMALFNQGDLAGAATEARTILRLKDNAAAHDLLGRVLGSQGELEDARLEFERALKIDPNFQQARDDVAMVKRALQNRK